MERSPFRATPPAPQGMGGSASTHSAAKASWQREIWATKTVMLESGLTKERTYILAAKAIGRQFAELENLSTRELRIVREFFAEELEG